MDKKGFASSKYTLDPFQDSTGAHFLRKNTQSSVTQSSVSRDGFGNATSWVEEARAGDGLDEDERYNAHHGGPACKHLDGGVKDGSHNLEGSVFSDDGCNLVAGGSGVERLE